MKANSYIKVEAEKRFRAIERFLKKSTREMDKMLSSIDDLHVTVEDIFMQMEICERKRESFALLSCDITIHDDPPDLILQQFLGDTKADGKPSPFPSPGNSKIQTKKQKEDTTRKKRRAGLPSKFAGHRITPNPTPQSSTLDDVATQPSEPLSPRQKQAGQTKAPKGEKTEPKSKTLPAKEKTTESSGDERASTEETHGSKKWKLSNLIRSKSSEAKSKESIKENKRRWWQFW